MAGASGFGLQSPNSNFVLRLRGYAQADGRFYLHDEAKNGTDTFLMRRVRPVFEGTFYHDFDFRLMPDFGNGAASSTLLQDAYLEWHSLPWLKVRVGKYKPPVGLEQQQSDADLLFMERGLPSDLVSQRNVGIQVSGDLLEESSITPAGYSTELLTGESVILTQGTQKTRRRAFSSSPSRPPISVLYKDLASGRAGRLEIINSRVRPQTCQRTRQQDS